ncbi:hypothetical protein E4U53_007453 [Claviceps sorghi]|nr:hypothetical protein E4U53_007453 [Claviceps sorghi]
MFGREAVQDTMPSTFYPFQRLPVDIRLCIWEFALRRSDRVGGLHYFSVASEPFGRRGGYGYPETKRQRLFETASYRGDTSLRIDALESDFLCRRRDSNKSVYLWDHGLWAACRESRRVIEKRCMRNRQHTPGYGPMWREYHDEYTVFRTVRAADDRTLRVMIQPYKDIFCLGYRDMDRALLRTADPLSSLFLGSAEEEGASDLRLNLALEFDPSWRFDLPMDPEVLRMEESPRGALARLIEKTFVDIWQISIWLIDREAVADAAASSEAGDCPVFRDMDVEYVRVTSGSRAFDLIRRLNTLLSPMYNIRRSIDAGPMEEGGMVPEIRLEDHVKILACRRYGE